MVCIYGITFDHTTNYGSCLQAYALQTAVERITVLNERCSYRLIPLQTLLETPPANFAGRIKRIVYWYYRKQFEEFENRYMKFADVKKVEALTLLNQQADAFMCGSDVVWNPDYNRKAGAYYLDFAQKEIEGKEPAAELYLTRAREKSARLKNLLDQNYSYTTMQDYFQMEKTVEPAYEVLRGFLGDINSGLEREGFFVRSEISFGHSRILVQRDAVARVFGNLMTNINKYASKEDEVLVCCREREKYVEVAAVNKVRIFEGEKPESTGFGSRISKRLMEEMNGDYSVEESDGVFTTTLRFLKV